MKPSDTYLVVCAVARASGGHRLLMDVSAVATYAALDPDTIRAVAACEVESDTPLLQYSRGRDQVGITVAGQDAIAAWDRQPYFQGELERRWIADQRAGYVGPASGAPEAEAPVAVPTGGSVEGGRRNGEEQRVIAAVQARRGAGRIVCHRCGKVGRYRPRRRVCTRCEAAAQHERDNRRER